MREILNHVQDDGSGSNLNTLQSDHFTRLSESVIRIIFKFCAAEALLMLAGARKNLRSLVNKPRPIHRPASIQATDYSAVC